MAADAARSNLLLLEENYPNSLLCPPRSKDSQSSLVKFSQLSSASVRILENSIFGINEVKLTPHSPRTRGISTRIEVVDWVAFVCPHHQFRDLK
ncbi:hypothetical protein Pfo_008828 [Paulownia fortunei]|nr:hypothetical protein Pfo_008828 [Paulownia fortunei]